MHHFRARTRLWDLIVHLHLPESAPADRSGIDAMMTKSMGQEKYFLRVFD